MTHRPRHRSVIIEADGGSRGNPGEAAYGAVLKDAETGEVIAEDGSTIGIASNNVAEYSGLIAGLRLAAEFAPDAEIEVRMDSKLVVEQMTGNWKIKHPAMKPLAMEADRLAPFGTTYTWVPRLQNAHADRLANEALDGKRDGVTVSTEEHEAALEEPESIVEEMQSPDAAADAESGPARGWAPPAVQTTVILVRHGVTAHTTSKRFSGGLGGDNPGLSDEGRAQIRAVADWIAPLAETVDVVITSPVRRTRESAEILAERLGHPLDVEPGFAEMEFGAWDGLTFVEVAEQHQADLDAWMGSLEMAPPGGETFRDVQKRVLDALDRLLAAHRGKTVVVVSHVTPIKTLVAHAVDAPLEAVFRMELAPASVTVLAFYEAEGDRGPHTSMRMYNALPPGNDPFGGDSKW
ncbi:MAG: bifunctional RNase H/acid phosphatase [Actinomycetota bacterium]|nr:bifunctional RNase H/acid phosphatase [Actinomycetota bacterium]